MSSIELSPEQKLAAFFPSELHSPVDLKKRHLVIEAGAGAGKTRVLTERVHWLLCTSPRNFRLSAADLILVTFSKAADEELRVRVEKEIKNATIPADEQQRILGRLHISTIDSLFMQIASNLFPAWWEQTKNKLSAEQRTAWRLNEQRFPPTLTLVNEAELIPELADEILQTLAHLTQKPATEIELLDFILSGAFASSAGFGSGQLLSARHRGLERVATAMLHENLLREDAPPVHMALERVHPSSLKMIELIQAKAKEHFQRRLMQGRLTHNDRMLFLYHLLCLKPENRKNGFFGLAEQQALPLNCLELIVDEYQDTNELQHEILNALLDRDAGRMVVVGDPKQSIYGFRSAHVGVFQRLKTDADWKLIELTRNYRSHPDLLPLLNLLSDLTFSYRNSRIPREFHDTGFALKAQQTFVGAKALDAGRDQPIETFSQPKSQSPRLLMLGASLNKSRARNEDLLKKVRPNTFAAWALARELKTLNGREDLSADINMSEQLGSDQSEPRKFAWSDMVVLCETNDHVAETQMALIRFGIPAVAKLSRPPQHSGETERRCEELGLLLAEWLVQPLEPRKLAEFLWSGWLGLTRDETSQVLHACSQGKLEPELVTLSGGTREFKFDERSSITLPAVWTGWVEHLTRCRSLSERHFFSAWQLLRWGYVKSIHTIAMENAALALHQALDVWSIRDKLENKREWPGEFISTQLQQLRLAQVHVESKTNAVTVCTIHGAKGLEWPVVVFWPNTSRERPTENFLMKSGAQATYIKWLAEDKESASLIPWIENPHRPTDQVAIQEQSARGELVTRWSADLQDKLEQDFERQRVFYTAFTRAREMLIIMSPSLTGRARSNLRDKLAALRRSDEFDPVALKLNGLEQNVFALFADLAFNLRKEDKRGSQPPIPWVGRETNAQCRVSDWQGLVQMRDYSPDWLDEAPELWIEADGTATQSEESAPQVQHDWISGWLEQQHQRAQSSPWQRTTEHSQQTPQETATRLTHEPADIMFSSHERLSPQKVIKPSEEDSSERKSLETDESSLSASEQGLRFHAFMEHADPKSIRGRNFLQKLLSTALVREHELEIWSSAETSEKTFLKKRKLIETQRRIIDLFCVVPHKSFPRHIWNSACVRMSASNRPENLNSLKTGTLDECFSEKRAVHDEICLVIDFKTGAPSEEHIIQMQRYLLWTQDILKTHPQQLVPPLTSTNLFTNTVRPLMGIIYYSNELSRQHLQNFASLLMPVDKNASVLFISPE